MTLGVLLALLFCLLWAGVWTCRVEATLDALPVYDRYERVWVVVTPLLMTLHFTLACLRLTTGAPPSIARALVAALVFCAAIVFWFWGRLAIGPTRARRAPDQAPRRFRRDGPFAVVRNPLYFSVLLAAAAPLVATSDPVLFATFGAAAVGIVVRLQQEERRMYTLLGAEFEAYCRDVKRLIPLIW